MRIIKWLLGIILLLVVVVLVGGYVFLKTFDLNKYKSYAEKIVYEQTGRKLSVNGDASLGISLIPTLVINDISFANPAWAKNPQMAEIGSLELKFSLLPLLKKQVVIDKAVVNNAKIYLETNAAGENNWTFAPVKAAAADKTAVYSGGWLISSANAAETAEATPAVLTMLTDIVAREVAVNNSEVQYLAAGSDPLGLKINSLSFSTEGMDQPMNISWDLVFNDMEITGKGNTGSLAGLFDAAAPWPLNVEATAANVKASVQAELYDLMNDLRTDFDINLYNPAGNFNAPETTLIASGSADLKKVSLDISTLNVVNNVITGTLSADIAGKVLYVAADLNSAQLDLRSFNRESPTAFVLPALISSAHASELVPDEAIPYELLNTVNGDFKIGIGKLVVNDAVTIDNLKLTASLNNGVLKVSPLQLQFGEGTIDMTAELNAGSRSLTLKADTDNLLLQSLHKEFQVENPVDFGIVSGGKSKIFADLKGSGATYRALVDSLSGQVIVAVDEATVQTGKLSFLTNSFVSQLLSVLNIDTEKVDTVSMKCAVVRADFENGNISFPKGIAVDSNKLSIVSGGTVNLRNDQLKLSLNAYRSGIADISIMQAVSNLVEIGGTLQNPKISLDKSGALKTIAGVAAGAAYAGADMLLDRDPAPCHTALKGTAYQNMFPASDSVSGAAQNAYRDASGAVGNTVSDAKDQVKALEQNARQLIKNLLK